MKKHLLRLAFINGLLFLSICIFAQEYSDFYFTRVNGENGLSESNVKAILQDSYGFMWFGTKMGSTAMMELLFSNSIAMIWRRVQVIIILVLFLRIKKGIYGLEQTGVFIYIIRRLMYLNVSK